MSCGIMYRPPCYWGVGAGSNGTDKVLASALLKGVPLNGRLRLEHGILVFKFWDLRFFGLELELWVLGLGFRVLKGQLDDIRCLAVLLSTPKCCLNPDNPKP